MQTARPIIDTHGHELTVLLPPDPVRLHGDPIRLAQVFANLLNNAAKYTEQPGQIRLSAECHDSHVVVRVRDNGIGITSDLLPHIFDLFVQASGSLARSQSGLGIGLTWCSRLVELHEGSVQACSDGPGRGSEFVVRFPVVADAAPVDNGSGSDASRSAPSAVKRILVVDDNVDSADSLAMLLRLQGHYVRTVYDGLSVIDVVREFTPQILLLDIGLPGKTGYEVAADLRSDPAFAGLVIAAVTGYGQDEDRQKSCTAGFDYHLVKPVELAAVQQVLDSAARAGVPVGKPT